MYPVIDFFGKQLSSYAVMAGVGILAGLFFVIISLRKDSEKQDNAMYIYGIAILGALLGAKLFFIFTVFSDFIADLYLITENSELFLLKYISNGWVFYGGLIIGLLFALLAAWLFKTKLYYYYTQLVPAVVLFAGIGRIGCFLAGCCYGIEAHTPISVVFPPGGVAPAGIELVPTQLIEAAIDGVIFVILIFYGKWQGRTSKGIDVLSLYLIMYSVMRFSLEFIRGDVIRGFFLGLSTSQWIAMIILVAVIAFHLFRRHKAGS